MKAIPSLSAGRCCCECGLVICIFRAWTETEKAKQILFSLLSDVEHSKNFCTQNTYTHALNRPTTDGNVKMTQVVGSSPTENYSTCFNATVVNIILYSSQTMPATSAPKCPQENILERAPHISPPTVGRRLPDALNFYHATALPLSLIKA